MPAKLTATLPLPSRHPRQDRSFKTLFERHPRDTLSLVAGEEAKGLPKDARIDVLPQEQLPRDHDGAVHHLDVFVRIKAPRWRRQFLVVTEEATEPRKFDALRLVEYVVRVCRRYRTRRVVPVVVFLRRGRLVRFVNIGTELETYIAAKFVVCPLAELPAELNLKGSNFAGWILSVAMSFRRGDGPRIYRQVVERIFDEVTDERERKLWLGVVEDLARLSARDWVEFRAKELPALRRKRKMRGYFTEMFAKAEKEAAAREARGEARGEAQGLRIVLELRGLRLTRAQQARIDASTDKAELKKWYRRALSATSASEVFKGARSGRARRAVAARTTVRRTRSTDSAGLGG